MNDRTEREQGLDFMRKVARLLCWNRAYMARLHPDHTGPSIDRIIDRGSDVDAVVLLLPAAAPAWAHESFDALEVAMQWWLSTLCEPGAAVERHYRVR